jgi:hypothetical protein
MGSLTEARQIDVDKAMVKRNAEMDIDMPGKRKLRENISLPGVPENSDSWWKEAKRTKKGVYAS